jgi:hypothetical protein
VIDISHPSGPIVASTSKPLKGAQVYDVDVSDSRLFVGHQELGIADFSNRSSIRTLGEFDGHIGRMRGVDVIGETAYVAQSMHSDASWLLVVDVSDPSAPRELGSFETTGGAQDVDVSGSIAFVADRADGLVLVDVSDPSNLKKCGFFQTTGHANNVNVAGPLVFLGIQGLQQSQLKILYHHR